MFWTRNLDYGIIFLISISSISYAKLGPCQDVPKLKILPGFGWNALKDKDTKQLLQVNYDQCKTTFDGKLLIPDNADVFALKSQEIEVKSSIFEHWSTYIPPTSASFKVATNVWPQEFLPLYYSLSEGYQQMKSLQVKNKTFTCRSEMRQVVYRVHIASRMNDAVKGRFMEVLSALVLDKTEEANTLTEKIVRDYGSHYTNIVDVGAVIVKEDNLKDAFLRAHDDGNRSKILSASKLSLLAIGFPWEHTQDLDSSLLGEYNDALVDKKIQFFGALNWAKGAKAEYVVAVDKSGDLLSSLVTSSNFPYYPNATLIRVRRMFNDAIRDYYERHIHRGCTQPKSNNFEFLANIDDGSCCNSGTSTNYGNLGNLEKIIERQESSFKQQIMDMKLNYSMKIEELEGNLGSVTEMLSKQLQKLDESLKIHKDEMDKNAVITRLKQIDLEEIIKRQEMEISSFEQQIVYYESNHSMKIQDLENNFDNLKEIIKRQNMEISLFKQQMVYHESNHSMKIQDLESNFVAEILDRQSNSSKQIQKLLETSELKTSELVKNTLGKLTKQQNENSVKIENCEKFLTTISTANNELAMAVAEDKKMLSNKIDKLENICDQQQNEMKGKLGKLEKQTEKQIEEIEMDLSNKIDELENICHQQQFRMRGIVENRIKKIEVDLKNQLTSTYVWKVDNFAQRPPKGSTYSYSNPFYTSEFGYKMRLLFHYHKIGDKDSHLSMYLQVMKGPYDAILDWPVKCRVRFSVLDQLKHIDHHTIDFEVELDKPVDTNTRGFHTFISLDKLKPLYLLDNVIFVQIDLNVTT